MTCSSDAEGSPCPPECGQRSGQAHGAVPVISGRTWLLGVPFHPWTMEETVQEIDRRIQSDLFTQHVAVNVALVVQMRDDPELRQAVLGAEIVSADGMGIVLCARTFKSRLPERVAGIDLFLRLLHLSSERGYPVYLLGAKPEVIERAVERLRSSYPRLSIAGWHHGYIWEDEAAAVDAVRNSGAKLLFVAISSPLKELFIGRWRERLGVRFAMGVGGSFDVVAGVTRRAPRWMQRAGLEWLFRLLQEPRRLWKRYLVTNVRFAGLLIGASLSPWRRNRRGP